MMCHGSHGNRMLQESESGNRVKCWQQAQNNKEPRSVYWIQGQGDQGPLGGA